LNKEQSNESLPNPQIRHQLPLCSLLVHLEDSWLARPETPPPRRGQPWPEWK
jgi:hypothetical protein